jgi:serine/threonine protein kinase
MDAHPALHPTDESLRSYVLGKLDDHSAEAVGKHLERCPDCEERVAGLSADSFVERARDAWRGHDSPAALGAGHGDPSMTQSCASQQALPLASTLPPELANHPDYEIIRELGHGGMGVVYLAHNRLMDRHEVLKVMGHRIVEQPGVLDRFLREIRAVARLRHPNIVNAYTAFRCRNNLVFAMEYVEGLDLARMVKARGPLPVENACYFVHHAALGLQHAHEEGMVHRDIKPANLMLTHKKGRAVIKVLDFGLSKATSEQSASELGIAEASFEASFGETLTRVGQMLGTPDYIAPEQIIGAQDADIRADIYSLGCTLYHLLSGRPPFAAFSSPYQKLRAHMEVPVPPLSEQRLDVPELLTAALVRMLAKNRNERFARLADVIAAVQPFTSGADLPGLLPAKLVSSLPNRPAPLASPGR